MKYPIIIRSFPGRRMLATLAFLALAGAPTLRAGNGDHERLEFKAMLVPTADATVGATGKAELKADDHNGITKAALKIETKGLAPATYTIDVVMKSDTTSVALGSLVVTGTVVSGVVSHDPSHKNDKKEKESSVVFGGKGGQPFPDGFDPFDIGGISIVDPNAVVVLDGDLVSPQSEEQTMLQVVQAIVPGVAAPDAQGKLTITAKSKKGVEKAVITLFVRKVPASLPFIINVNGTDLGQAISTKNGQVRLGQTPGKHKGFAGFGQEISGLDLQSITLTTLTGENILSVTR